MFAPDQKYPQDRQTNDRYTAKNSSDDNSKRRRAMMRSVGDCLIRCGRRYTREVVEAVSSKTTIGGIYDRRGAKSPKASLRVNSTVKSGFGYTKQAIHIESAC